MILTMVKEGKINAEDADKLLHKIKSNELAHNPSADTKPFNKKFLKIIITENDTTTVNINIPLALAEVGLKLIPEDKLKIKGHNLNIQEILQLINEETGGELVNIHTIENDKEVKVKIFIK